MSFPKRYKTIPDMIFVLESSTKDTLRTHRRDLGAFLWQDGLLPPPVLRGSQGAAVCIEMNDMIEGLKERAKEKQRDQADRGIEGGRGNKKTEETLSQLIDGGFKDINSGKVDQQLAETFGTNRQYVSERSVSSVLGLLLRGFFCFYHFRFLWEISNDRAC